MRRTDSRRFVRRRPRPRPEERDDGMVLPMALVLTVILAMVVMSIAAYAVSTLKYGNVVKTRVDRLSAADGGARIGLEKLRTNTASCSTSGGTIHSGTIGGQSVQVTCQRAALQQSDVGRFALVVTAQGVPAGTASWIAQGNNVASQPRGISGNVYLAAPPASLDKPVAITNGDLWYTAASNGSCTDPSYSNLTFKPAGERGYMCTTNTWQSMFPQPPLPAKTNTSRQATGKTNNSTGCTVFQPGVYRNPPVIGSGTQNFFQPGTYYFDFEAAFTIKNAVVVAGGPNGGGSSPVARTSTTTVSAPWCASQVSAASGGVTWVFGTKSQLSLESNAQLEVFAPPALSTDPTMMTPSIVALQNGTSDYAANTLGSTGTPLVSVQEGSSSGIVVHGGVWAPVNGVLIGNIAESANGQFLGGLVVGTMNMQAAANTGNFNLAVPITPAVNRVALTSTSGNTKVSVVAILRPSDHVVSINSWRVG